MDISPAGSGRFGIYVHVPFCAGGKCPYCDFYSVPYSPAEAEEYIAALSRQAARFAPAAAGMTADTVYFGGGTPSLLGERIAGILDMLRGSFDISPAAEITAEANPGPAGGLTPGALSALAAAGVNRLSIGMQSASPEELRLLGRRHSPQDTAALAARAKDAGIDNISLDLMLATPGQTPASLERSVDFAASLGPKHISAYLLKVEPGTPFFEKRRTLSLPDDDGQADFYLAACERLEKHGFMQYEISNFALPGFESRHNLRYWDCGEYLGFGPGAHSFFGGRRFYFPRSLGQYLSEQKETDDGAGGSLDEYVMLRLRLSEGVSEAELRRRYGVGFEIFGGPMLAPMRGGGLLTLAGGRLSLTRRGMLVSNSVIAELLAMIS